MCKPIGGAAAVSADSWERHDFVLSVSKTGQPTSPGLQHNRALEWSEGAYSRFSGHCHRVPVDAVDVERSFSRYNTMVSDRYHSVRG